MTVTIKTRATATAVPVKKKPKKKKRKQKKQGKIQTNDDGSISLNRVALVREQLHGPAKFIGDKELAMLVTMDTSLASIQNRMRNRMIIACAVVLLGLIGGAIFRAYFAAIAGFAIIVAGLTWLMDTRKTSSYYMNYRLERQIAFAQFTRLAAAYLPELSQGSNLYSIFKKILPRMDNERDHASLETLMIDMQVDPDDPRPFMKFAHEFSASDSSEMIMGTIQQMYQGNVDDRNIRALADLANEDMIRQIDDVIKHKITKFNNITTRVAMCSGIVIFGFLGLLLTHTFMSLLGSLLSSNPNNTFGGGSSKGGK